MATVASALTGTDVGNQKAQVIAVKNQRVVFGEVIAGSADGVTGGMDGVDRWMVPWPDYTSQAKFPWMVITRPGSGAQDLLYHNIEGGESDWGFAHSPSGSFSGGSATTPPSAPDVITALYANSFFGRGDGGTNPQFVTHIWVSKDLTCSRQSHWFGGLCIGNVFYDSIIDPASGHAHPSYGLVDKHGVAISTAQDTALMLNFVETPFAGVGLFKGWGPHGELNMMGTCPGTGYGGLFPVVGQITAKDKISGLYRLPSTASGLHEPIANADGGYRGQVFDLWWVQNATALFAPGSTLPLDGSKQFVVLGDFMLEWNGTPFQTGAATFGSDIGDFDFVADLSQCPLPPATGVPPVLVNPAASSISQGPGRFGTDIDAYFDVPIVWGLASGLRNLGNQLARRLSTVLGTMPDDPNYGFDVRDFLNGGFTTAQLGQIQSGASRECLKDPRVQDCAAIFSWNSPLAAMTVTLQITTADGTFEFVLGVSDLTVELLDASVVS